MLLKVVGMEMQPENVAGKTFVGSFGLLPLGLRWDPSGLGNRVPNKGSAHHHHKLGLHHFSPKPIMRQGNKLETPNYLP